MLQFTQIQEKVLLSAKVAEITNKLGITKRFLETTPEKKQECLKVLDIREHQINEERVFVGVFHQGDFVQWFFFINGDIMKRGVKQEVYQKLLLKIK